MHANEKLLIQFFQFFINEKIISFIDRNWIIESRLVVKLSLSSLYQSLNLVAKRNRK